MSDVVTGVMVGLDTIKYSVSNSCGVSTAVYPVTVNSTPTVGPIIGLSELCVGATIELVDTTKGGVWSGGNENIILTGSTVIGVFAGIDTVKYSITNFCGTDTASHIITVNPVPFAGTILGTSNVCVGSVLTLSDTVNNGTWNCSNLAASVINGMVTGLMQGIDTVEYSVANDWCNSTATKIITVNPLPVAGVITGPGYLCMGDSVIFSDTATGGVWSVSNDDASIEGSLLVNGISTGVDTIYYSVTNNCGTATALLPVTVNQLPVTTEITHEKNILIVDSSYAAYEWSLNGAVIAGATSNTYIISETGTYSVVVTNGFDCKASYPPLLISDCPVEDLQIFPNPTDGIVHIQWCKNFELRLSCMDGKLIRIEKNSSDIDLSTLPNGNYMLSVFDNYKKIKSLPLTKLAR